MLLPGLPLPWQRTVAATLGGVVLAAAGVLAVGAPAAAAGPCRVTYTVVSNWGSGFQALLELTPGAAVTGWAVDFDLADQQVLSFAYSSMPSQSGRHVTLTNASFNGSVAAGATVRMAVGVNLNPTGTNVPPALFTMKGQVCDYTPQGYLVAGAYRPMVPEGGSITLPISLSKPPPANIVVSVASNTLFSGSPASLTFTPANWNVPQPVTITSPEDPDTTSSSGYLWIQQQNYVPSGSYVAAILQPVQADND